MKRNDYSSTLSYIQRKLTKVNKLIRSVSPTIHLAEPSDLVGLVYAIQVRDKVTQQLKQYKYGQ